MRYTKKPVTIDAWQVPGLLYLAAKEIDSLPKVIRDGLDNGTVIIMDQAIIISTLEGQMTAGLDDWIICGVKGELYPCKPDIFAMTYERQMPGEDHFCPACGNTTVFSTGCATCPGPAKIPADPFGKGGEYIAKSTIKLEPKPAKTSEDFAKHRADAWAYMIYNMDLGTHYSVNVDPYGQVHFNIGVQSFALRTINHEESPDYEHAEYMARMLRKALGKLTTIPPAPQYSVGPAMNIVQELKEKQTQPGGITWAELEREPYLPGIPTWLVMLITLDFILWGWATKILSLHFFG